MPELQTLAIFSAAVLGLLVAPGPNMAFLFAHSFAQGPRGGLAVATGIFLADLVLSALTAAGVTATLMALPVSFDAIRIAGALYLLLLAIQSFRASASAQLDVHVGGSFYGVAGQAMLNSLLNPKALLFFLVFLPQFVDPDAGQVTKQLAVLGLVLSIEALAFHAVLGVSSGFVGETMSTPRARLLLGRCQGLILLGLAMRLVVMGRPATT